MKKLLLSLIVLITLFSGCKDDKIGSDDKGELALRLHSEGEFKSASSVDVGEFKVNITSGDKAVHSWDKYSDVPAVIILEPANYSIVAASPGDLDVAWDQPIFDGKQDFLVESGKVTDIALTCFITNMKVTVTCTERFYNEMREDYTITVTSSKGALIFNKDVLAAGKAGYFTVSPLKVHIRGVRKTTEAPINHLIEIPDGEAKDHHKIEVDVIETGHVSLGAGGITIDYTVNDKVENVLVPGFDEEELPPAPEPEPEPEPEPTPDPEPEPEPDPDPDPDPEPVDPITITAPGITEPLVLTDAEATSADVSIAINTGTTISELWVTIESAYLEGLLPMVNIPKTFDMANLTSELEKTLTSLGLLTGPVKGQKSYSFSIGSFMPLMQSDADPVKQIYKFHVRVVDAVATKLSATVTIKRVP